MCKYKKSGVCIAPIPVKCSDECGLKHETELYNSALKELEESREEIETLQKINEDCRKEYERLEGQYNSLLDRYNKLLKEIGFTN